MSFVLFYNSATQRVAVRTNYPDEGKILVSKEWRKTSNDGWRIGKGIVFHEKDLVSLGDILKCCDDNKLNNLLSNYELIQECDDYDNKEEEYI